MASDRERVERVADAARRFLAAYDEFGTDYPEAIGEHMDALIDAVDALGDTDAVETMPSVVWPYARPILPEYEP